MAFTIILTIVGLVLVLSEIFLIPGVGVAGVLGVLSLGGACYYVFYEFGLLAGAVFTAAILAVLIGLIVYTIKTRAWKKLALNTKIDSKVQNIEEEALSVGDSGKAVTRLAPIGTARFDGKAYEVKSLEGMIDAGTEVEVVMFEDNKIYVRPVSADF
ncbi:MAG: NfeD family protein [Bacteroidetes bacterium]|jgi:membrane-bound ClpP family serine protease|uniref:NfeD family protein n=1 Tax=Candidatus Cryptobacteroides avicola TaxID=2840757 RepID=A0A940DRU2_9BACT|nr:NfeD family protein [Candidatus Cryptobacteroides avicola]